MQLVILLEFMKCTSGVLTESKESKVMAQFKSKDMAHTEIRHNQNPITSFLVAPRFFDVGPRHKTNRNKEKNQSKWNKQWQTCSELHKCQKKTKEKGRSEEGKTKRNNPHLHTMAYWLIKTNPLRCNACYLIHVATVAFVHVLAWLPTAFGLASHPLFSTCFASILFFFFAIALVFFMFCGLFSFMCVFVLMFVLNMHPDMNVFLLFATFHSLFCCNCNAFLCVFFA